MRYKCSNNYYCFHIYLLFLRKQLLNQKYNRHITMAFSYIDQSADTIKIYGGDGVIISTLSGIEGSLCGFGSDFLVMDCGGRYNVINSSGQTLHSYSKEHGHIVAVAANGITIREGARFVKYDRNGFEKKSVDAVDTIRQENRLQKISRMADKFITMLIILNAIAAGAMTYLSDDSIEEYWLNIFCDISIVIFVIEIVVKIAANGKAFFRGDESGWNIFDLIVTVISSLSFFTGVEGLVGARAIRILRELRLLRVISGSANMKRIFHALIYALPQISWASIFFVLLYYIYGIIGVEMFGASCERFATLHQSFLTLMQIMTFDDWAALTRDVMQEHPWSWIYFVTYVILAAYILVNLLVGIVVDSLNEVRSQEELNNSDISRELSKLEQQLETVKKLIKGKDNEAK